MGLVHRNRASIDWPRVLQMLAWNLFDPADVPMASLFHA
jgi:hypothetical protein